MLQARSLRKALVPRSLIAIPSPGSLQATRLAVHVNDDSSAISVYIASGCRVFKMELSMEGSLVAKGKESLLIPTDAKVINSSMVDRGPHRSEIQSIALSARDGGNLMRLGTIDSFGHLIVSQLDVNGADIDRLSYSVLPHDCGVGEGSWAGISFNPTRCSMAAVCHCLCRRIDFYDQDIHLRSLHTLWYPAAISFLTKSTYGDGGSVLAVAEGSQLAIYDLRANYNGGCVQRLSSSIGDSIYAVCSSSSGAIGVGGSDRSITIYDPRRWSAISRWANCSKYEITGLSFSSINSSYIFVQGIDHEVFCGSWEENKRAFSFRGDSNWLGFSNCADKDVLAGWCDSGGVFVADVQAAPVPPSKTDPDT